MTSIIDSIVDKEAAEIEAANNQKEKERQDKVNILLELLKARLGDFWKTLEERDLLRPSITWEGSRPELRLEIPAIDEERLAPIKISVRGSGSGYYSISVNGYTFETIGAALYHARKYYHKFKEEDREKKSEAFNTRLHYGWNKATESEEEAQNIVTAFIEEFPDLESQARATLAEWIESKERYLERQAQERRKREEEISKRALLKTIRMAYVIKLAEWMKEHDEIVKNNLTLAALIQEEADLRSYTVYKLTYALMASYEEDGETYREINTRSVWTLYAIPDSFGFWNIDGKKIEIYNPVTLEMSQVKPSSGILAKTVAPGGIDLYFHPDTTDEAIERIIAGIEPLPEEPEIPEELLAWDRYPENYRKEARELLSGESEPEDIPF